MASRAVLEEPESGRDVAPHVSKRAFAEAYLTDEETGGNATRSFLKVLPGYSPGAAAVQASLWLRDPEVVKYLRDLRKEILKGVSKRVLPWSDLVPEAQATLVAIMRGQLRSRLMFDAACEVLSRALGQPASHVEVSEVNVERATQALRMFSQRRTKVVTTEEMISVGVVGGGSNGEVLGMVSEGRQVMEGEQVPAEVSEVSEVVSEVSGGE